MLVYITTEVISTGTTRSSTGTSILASIDLHVQLIHSIDLHVQLYRPVVPLGSTSY